MEGLKIFLSGGAMMGFLVASLFFLRFWKSTSDRLFLYFSASFGLMAVERWALLIFPKDGEYRPFVFLIRLAAFVTIVMAIVRKNRAS